MSDLPDCFHALSERLRGSIPRIDHVREICQVPSVSVGVVHQNQIIFRESVGYRDPEKRLKPDADTIYMIGSCSKMLTSAAVGILVDEGKLQWRDPIQKYLPEFNPEGDHRIGKEADLIDVLRHSTGLTSPAPLCLGPRGSILTNEEDLISILNVMPTANNEGQKFNRYWEYNNFSYGLMAAVVERVTGQRFADFVRERILEPLGMTRTAVSRTDIAGDDNVATSYAILEDGGIVELNSGSWPCENHSSLLAATGMRSSINDMLRWCMAVLSAERIEQNSQSQCGNFSAPTSDTPSSSRPQSPAQNSPLKQMLRVRRGYWTRPSDDPSFSKAAAYCMGWIRMDLPSSMIGSFSGNRYSREKGVRSHLQHILGVESDPFLAIGHTGGNSGSISTVWTFPETQSAVVTMTNGRSGGDASDFAAQILIQELFDLRPHVDLIPWVKKEAELQRKSFEEKIMRPWRDNQRRTDTRREPQVYVGEYRGFNGLFTLDVIGEKELANPEGCQQSVIFNGRKATKLPLTFFRKDTYSFLPQDRNTVVTEQVIAPSYKNTLLEFKVDDSTQRAIGLWWQWDEDETAWLERVE